jgi:hypothetical protein
VINGLITRNVAMMPLLRVTDTKYVQVGADQVRPPDLMHSDCRCDQDGPVLPLHLREHIGQEILEMALSRYANGP